ncbi:ubiquitin-protein ligase [Lithospermum erythrorhizon]|uniref:RING-type E3 ubiquitin transferase n=1 Tax=Lithospermum erythrorhizon TaxID=34254 RepID=A0AAV3QEC6_LITER
MDNNFETDNNIIMCEEEGEGSEDKKQEMKMLMLMMMSSSLMEMEGEGGINGSYVVREILEVIENIGYFGNFRKIQRKECLSLVRRLKLLVPLLEEIKELLQSCSISDEAFNCFLCLKKALLSAKKLLKQCNYGSKIFLALENEAILVRFHHVYDKLYGALEDIPYEELGISEEVKEQVELMRMQLNRAKRRTETQDIELAMDMMVVFSKTDDCSADRAVIERLAKKLDLCTIADLKSETMAVNMLLKDGFVKKPDYVQHIMELLGKFKQIAGMEETNELDGAKQARPFEKCPSFIIPHEFLCPITLEIMTDPVIVATGQTYERESIQKWFNSGHHTCPKTGQTLSHLTLAPNFALYNLIVQCCKENNYDLPKKVEDKGPESYSSAKLEEILFLVQNLSSSQPEVLREAITKIRMLSKKDPENRIMIAKNGGITSLVRLLSNPESDIQEHAVTALLNLSLAEANKPFIVQEGAIRAIIEVLKNGTEEAKENSAAALFSLSTVDENKLIVGCSNGIPPLVDLLRSGTARGKKDAATALFNLTLNPANKSRAIEAGIIQPLLDLIEDRQLGMVDEALSILLLVASHPDGRNEIGELSFVQTLIGIIKDGTPKNKECAAALLLVLGSHNFSVLLAALQYGAYDHLRELSTNGTNRARRKANSLLRLISKSEHIG